MRTPGRVAASIAGLLLAACGGSRSEPAAPESGAAAAGAPSAALVEVRRVELGNVPTVIEASGTVRARRVSGLGAEVGGRLLEVLVDLGDVVEEGAPLFRIDPVPYEVALADARAGLALARAERDNALQERERVEKLVERQAISVQRRDQQRTVAAVATARVAQMEARVARARSDLDRTLVRAPYPGSVVERLAHEGEMAGPEPVVVLQESGALVVALNIPESAPVPVEAGARVRLFAEGSAAPIETRVERVSRRVHADTRTYEVRAPVHDPSGALKAGSYVRAKISPTAKQPRPVVDRSALLMRDGRTYVFRVDDGEARRVPVRVGAMTADRVEILSGVEVGDAVVRGEAVGLLADGDRIRTAPEDAEGSSHPGAAS